MGSRQVKYRELVQFDPIEEVIELRDADKADRAKALVRTYVVSDAMERRLVDLFAPLLDFSCLEAKGIFVVGNYGTGKSHLMAIVSALAENSALLDELGNAAVREAFRPVAGRYLVARFEIGAVTTPLRTIVIRELEKHLKAWGVEYAFPAADQITNHKDAIEAMLAAVEAKHPGKGVLIVIADMLDYLKALGGRAWKPAKPKRRAAARCAGAGRGPRRGSALRQAKSPPPAAGKAGGGRPS